MAEEEDEGARPLVDDQIDANLKRVYQEIVGDDVPDRFRKLLDQLRMQDGAGDGDAAEPRAREGGHP